MFSIIKKLGNTIEKLPRISVWITLLCWFVVALVVVYMIPPLSPSNPLHYRSDSSVFRMIGTYWLDGMLPYQNLFDHKGPLLYAAYALGVWLHPGKLGVYFVIALCLGVSYHYLFRIARLFLNRSTSLLVTLTYVIICYAAFCGCSEDLSLPFVVIPLYYFIRHLKRGDSAASMKAITWLGMGICFGIILLIRPNNAAVLCATIGFYGISMLLNKQYREFMRAAIVCASGAVIPFVPVLGYFYMHGALHDCIYGSYLFNFSFAGQGIASKSLTDWLTIVKYSAPFWLILIFGRIAYKNGSLSGICYSAMLTISSLAGICLIPGKGYLHYFIFYSPCVIFSLICVTLCLKNIRNIKITISAFAASIAAYASYIIYSLIILRYALYGAFMPDAHAKHRSAWEEYHTCQKIQACIPPNELNSVLMYNGQGDIYLYLDAKPPTRYFMLQEFLLSNVPSIRETLEANIVDSAPKWIIIRHEQYQISALPLQQYITENCEQVTYDSTPGPFLLFRRKF